MAALRDVDSSARPYGVPSSLRALVTSVEVTQWVDVSPSTVNETSRPKRTTILEPSLTGSSSSGATRSCSVTSMPSEARTSATVSPPELTSRVCPSRVSW